MWYAVNFQLTSGELELVSTIILVLKPNVIINLTKCYKHNLVL